MEKKIICKICNKFFSSYQSKSNHNKQFHRNNEQIIKENNITCNYCNKILSNKSSLTRHQKSYCKSILNIVNNITINNNIQNIQNNNLIQINPYNKPRENFTLLDICNIFDKEFSMILKLIETTYFNEHIEDNHTFYVSNLQGPYINTVDDTKLKKYFFDELFGISLERIKLLYKTYKNKLFEIPKQVEIQEKIKALEDMRSENNHNYKSYLKLINVLAYDKKDLVINTWTKLKQLELLDDNKDNEEII